MVRNPLAERYAKALISAAETSSETEQVKNDILMLAHIFHESDELPNLLERAAKHPEITESLCGFLESKSVLAPMTVKLLNILSTRKRMGLLPEITGAYLGEMRRKQGIVQAQVTSVRSLESDECRKIQERLDALAGNTVDIQWLQDTSLLGGLFIQIGDTVLDGTLKTRINQLKQHLIQ